MMPTKIPENKVRSVLKEYYSREDNSATVIAKKVGISRYTVMKILSAHFEEKEKNPPIKGKERDCDCYRGLKRCFCKIR